jgi:mannose-6-phosphate isomerase-like protein (cupin superfamily)
MLLVAATGADTTQHATTNTLEAAVTTTKDGVAVHTVFADSAANTLFVRRDASGVVERHARQNDVMIARTGTVTMLLGGTIEGGAETSPGEWRGGRIIGGHSQRFDAGDMLWIPAGVPHQMILPKGSSFTYAVVKTGQ